MFGFFHFFRIGFFIYLGLGVLFVSIGYDFIDKNYPNIELPYKERVFKLRKIIIDKVDQFIDYNDLGKEVQDGIEQNNPFK